ncbi:MAG: DUF718 domain-containing protein [Burkholderiales bacterium]|nr:DUF718 domain-containing protein [Burkholderiales bacterium]
MAAFNVVRSRVKAGNELAFVDRHRRLRVDLSGFQRGSLVRTGERTFCLIGQWRSMQDIVQARPQMAGILDGMRELREELGGGPGLTGPVSGDSVHDFGP